MRHKAVSQDWKQQSPTFKGLDADNLRPKRMPPGRCPIHIAAKPISINCSDITMPLQIIKLMRQLVGVHPLVITGAICQITPPSLPDAIEIIAYNPKITLPTQIPHLARIPPSKILTDLPGPISAAIVTDNNLKRPRKTLPQNRLKSPPKSISLIISNNNNTNIHKNQGVMERKKREKGCSVCRGCAAATSPKGQANPLAKPPQKKSWRSTPVN